MVSPSYSDICMFLKLMMSIQVKCGSEPIHIDPHMHTSWGLSNGSLEPIRIRRFTRVKVPRCCARVTPNTDGFETSLMDIARPFFTNHRLRCL